MLAMATAIMPLLPHPHIMPPFKLLERIKLLNMQCNLEYFTYSRSVKQTLYVSTANLWLKCHSGKLYLFYE